MVPTDFGFGSVLEVDCIDQPEFRDFKIALAGRTVKTASIEGEI
jgi:hypothetical protein